MAGDAIFIGWGTPTRGREQKALQVFGEAVDFWSRMQQEGKIESLEPVFLAPHGGDLNGFFIVRGERDALDEIARSDEFERINTRAAMVVESLGVVQAYCGEGVQRAMGIYQEAVSELAG